MPDDAPQDRSRQPRPEDRRPGRTGDPYTTRDPDRDLRSPAPRSDRPRLSRPRDERPDAYSPDDHLPRQRYGAITPSDDLAWPDPEPAEAEWQPAPQRGRPAGARNAPPRPRRDDPAPRQTYGAVPSDHSGRPTGQPAWSTFEPNTYPTADDELAYDVYPTDAANGHRGRPAGGDEFGGGFDDEWSSGRPADDGDGAGAADGDWYPAEGEPDADQVEAWSGGGPSAEPDESGAIEPFPGDDPRSGVFADPQRPSRRSSGHGSGVRPPVWGLSGYAWRFARRLTIARTNRLLRFGASRVLPVSSRARFEAMGLPPTEVDETLRQVRSLDDWAEAWTGTAQRFLGETRRGGDMTPTNAARSRQLAALCYHVASFFAFGDDRLARTSRSAATTLFGQSLGLLMPETRRVNVRWRSKTMPGYLTVPSWATGRRPLAVLLNGTTTSREELIMWSEEFLVQGLAVLALDTPGFGEGIALGTVSLDNDDIMDGIFELAESDPGLDPTRVSLVGVGLGGTMAFRAAAGERRVSAVVAVTPIHEPARWLGASSQVVLAQMVPQFGGYDQLADFVLGLDMPATLAATQAQVLVFGAGHDLVVPAPEASRLAAALGEQATLVWFDDAGHALFDAVPEWTREAAEWLAVVMDVTDAPIFAETAETTEAEYPEDGSEPDDGYAPGDRTGLDALRDDGAVVEDFDGDRPDDETPASSSGAGGRPTVRRGPARPGRTDGPRMAEAPAPAPYGAEVFDASQGAERRSGQQRGYETGVFGPLGPAAARILADEPTPQPGSPEWGYEDGSPWNEAPSDSPWEDHDTRPAPSTARLWESRQPAERLIEESRPTMARPAVPPAPAPEPAVSERPVMARPGQPASVAAPNPLSAMGDYLSSSAPPVGRGRTSERFMAVPPPESDPAADVADGGSETTADPTRPSMATDQLAPDGPSPGVPIEVDEAVPGTDDGPEPEANADSHAPFRPPPDRTDHT